MNAEKFAECSIENFELIVSERVQAKLDNSRAGNESVNSFIIQTECITKIHLF